MRSQPADYQWTKQVVSTQQFTMFFCLFGTKATILLTLPRSCEHPTVHNFFGFFVNKATTLLTLPRSWERIRVVHSNRVFRRGPDAKAIMITFWSNKISANRNFRSKKGFERIELPAKLLDYFLQSNTSNINQFVDSSRHTANPTEYLGMHASGA